MCTLPDILTHLLFKMCMTSFQKSTDVRKNLCGHMQFTSMPNLFKVQNVRKSPHEKKTKSEFYASFCGRPQAFLRRAADVRKKIAPAHTEKCLQKSAGFDKGMDICGFVADICGHTPTSTKIYSNVRGSLHMSAAYARPVADIEGTGQKPIAVKFHIDPIVEM